MIYVDIDVKDWIKKYPDLKALTASCNNCGKDMNSTRAFITKDYAGLESPMCSCGKNTNKCMTYVTTTKEAHQKWVDALTIRD